MDSSPDLSLKLRRGSSDSRDSFYMDFAQGIDSDIEEVDNTIIARPPPPPPVLPDPEPEPEQELEQQPQQELISEPEIGIIEPVRVLSPPPPQQQQQQQQQIPLSSNSPILPPSSPVSITNIGDYSESDVTIISAELPPLDMTPSIIDVIPTISPPPLPPNSLPLLPRLSLTSTTSASSSQQLPPPPLISQGTISDSTTSSPSPPPTPPPPPPLSIPPPPPDPLPPRHEPHSPTLSESSSSLLFHHHHHHTHNPHYQLPSHLRDYMPLELEQDIKSEQQQQQQPILEPNHINSITTRKTSIVSTGIATTPDTPSSQQIISAGSSDGDTVSSVIATSAMEPQHTTIQIIEDDYDNDDDDDDDDDDANEEDDENNGMTGIEDNDEDDDEEDEPEEEDLEGAEEIIAGDDDDDDGEEDDNIDDGYDANIEDDTINGISSHIIETHSDDILNDTSSLIINMPHTGPILLDESTILEMPAHPPSPISPGNILVSSESVSRNSSPVKSSSRKHSGSQHRVTIDESHIPLSASSTHHQLVTIATGSPSAGSSHQQLFTTTTINTAAATTSTTVDHDVEGGGNGGGNNNGGGSGGNGAGVSSGHLALMYHSHHHHHYPMLPSIRKTTSRQSYSDSHYTSSGHNYQEIKAGDALATTFSALYGKLLVVMGIAFPMAEVISTYIPPSFYEVYYLYLYIGSMLFLFFMYATLLWGRPKIITTPTKKPKKKLSRTSSASESMEESDTESASSEGKRIRSAVPMRRPSLLAPLGGRNYHYGSFYLRMGAVAFGIGSMIYSGLEFGQYFELERDTKCHNVMLALTPATRMAFIFIQMYFIFLNNEQIKVYRHKIIARFGLMHMIGTNLSVWLNVLIQETKHEILTFYNPENRTLRISHRLGNKMQHFDNSAHLRVTRGLKGPYQIFECRRTNIIGTLVQDASPFLFPCTIEYSLICAAILYVMWRSIAHPSNQTTPQRTIETGHSPLKRSPHHYSVDCARAHKGLFIGILILVLTIISLILFFVLISRPEFVTLAVTEVTICELTIYATATIATVIGMIQVRHLQYDAARSFQLDDILLVGAQTGLFLYSTFTVIGGHFTMRKDTVLVLITALASIVQTAFQTMFILDASRRQAVSPEHIRKKPGREIVTFMLVANLAMWAISTLEKSRAESHPIQLNFYGLWAWTIITHVSMPLAIFYRFHSTVCLCEIWKRAYKLKPAYM